MKARSAALSHPRRSEAHSTASPSCSATMPADVWAWLVAFFLELPGVRVDRFMPLDAIERFEWARAAERHVTRMDGLKVSARAARSYGPLPRYIAKPVDGGCTVLWLLASPYRRAGW